MAHSIDPVLQDILENAGSFTSSSRFPPQVSSRSFSNGLQEYRFQPHQQNARHRQLSRENYSLDYFDRTILHSTNPISQTSEENRNSSSSLTAHNHSGIFSLAIPTSTIHRQALHGLPSDGIGHLLPTAQQYPHRRDLESRNIICGTSSFAKLQPQYQQATPPFLASCTVTPPWQTTQNSSPQSFSSPTSRLTLRRQQNQRQKEFIANQAKTECEGKSLPPRQQVSQLTSHNEHALLNLPHDPPMVNGIQLVPTQELSDRFRQIFPFALFNAVQSKCFSPIYKTDDNVVVSAPTGSGKTAILELAICKLIEGHKSGQFKIVYQAPTKSLCAERVRDWQKKFRHLNLDCAELTGDTNASEMRKVGNATVIITTPEKWDSITRKWKDYIKLLQMVKLFLIDEVHILKDCRGATLEAVVSRMKSIGANVRFVALSATVPNSQDIATWLGKDPSNSHLPAHRETFGESFRPVKLQKHVYGFDSNANDYAFDTILDGKLPALIKKHTHKKPIMVFCFTRKSCEQTATKLAEWWASCRVTEQAWLSPSCPIVVGSHELKNLVPRGVAFHHAGLDPQDRAAIENAFLQGQLSVICCTSTLSVGVNLPCHLVVIKGTVGFQDDGLGEYSDLEVMQMLGRAGRPQFDDSAVAIIMTRTNKVDRYNKMISGQDILESTLHLNLIEHLNSEIGLGTIHDVHSAKQWLAGTFLSVRMRQNPSYYEFSCASGSRDADERLEMVYQRDIKLLQTTKLVTDEGRFACTEYGQAMSRYMVQFKTMKLLLSIPKQAKIGQILHIICQAAEFKDLRFKTTERAGFRELNCSPLIKFPIKETITTYSHKVSLIIQTQLGGVELPTNKEFNRRQYQAEKLIVFDRIQRLVRCVIDCKAHDSDGYGTNNTLELARSISAEFWDNTPAQLRQIPNIGPATVKKMIQSNINSIEKLAAMDTAGIERTMSKNPPFGRKLLDLLKNFPCLTLNAEIVGKTTKAGQSPVIKIRSRLGFSNSILPFWRGRSTGITFLAIIDSGRLAHFWRGNIRTLEKGFDITFSVGVIDASETITCYVACEEIVGTTQTITLRPEIHASAFPTSFTTNKLSRKHDLEEDELSENEDLEFYMDGINDTDLIDAVKGAEPPTSDYGSAGFERFVNIDDIVTDSPESEIHPDPMRMENGRYICNHKCSNGRNKKNGSTCKHKCCHDGLDKPRRLANKKSAGDMAVQRFDSTLAKPHGPNTKIQRAVMASEDIETVDLTDDIPFLSYADRQYRKLHNLHSKVQKNEDVRITQRTPKYSYTSVDDPDLSFLQFDQENYKPHKQQLPAGTAPSYLTNSCLKEEPLENTLGVIDGGQHHASDGYEEQIESEEPDVFDSSTHVKLKRVLAVSPGHAVKRCRTEDDGKSEMHALKDETSMIDWAESEEASLICSFADFIDFI